MARRKPKNGTVIATVIIGLVAVAGAAVAAYVVPRRADGAMTCAVTVQMLRDEAKLSGQPLVAWVPDDWARNGSGGARFADDAAKSDPLGAIDYVIPDCRKAFARLHIPTDRDHGGTVGGLYLAPNGKSAEVLYWNRCSEGCGRGASAEYERKNGVWVQVDRQSGPVA